MPSIDVYYDYRSPYAYFTSKDLPAVAKRTPFEAVWRPVSIHILLNLQIGRDPWTPYEDPLPPIKRRYLLQDVMRGAEQRGLPIQTPASLNSLGALDATLKLQGSTVEPAFRDRVFRALWEEQKDISKPAVLEAIAADLGEEARQAVRSAKFGQPENGEALRGLETCSLEAFNQGVFGVPSFVLDGEVFFGADRLDVLEWRLGRST